MTRLITLALIDVLTTSIMDIRRESDTCRKSNMNDDQKAEVMSDLTDQATALKDISYSIIAKERGE